MTLEMEDNYQKTLVFFSPLAVQEKTSMAERLPHVIPPDQWPAVSSLHAEQVPTVMAVGTVYSNRHSRTPANTQQSTFAAANSTKSISFSVNYTTGKPSVSSHPRSLCSKESGARMGKGEEEHWEGDRELNEPHPGSREVPCTKLL